MLVNVTKIGNSKGVIIPAHLLKALEIDDKISLDFEEDRIVLSPVKAPRAGWEEALIKSLPAGEEIFMDGISNDFDGDDWTW